MARAPKEEPRGLVYHPELIDTADEARLLEIIGALRFDPIFLHGQEARRKARHFGLDYDYGGRVPRPGEPIPDWVLPLRARAALLAGRDPDELVEILAQKYPPRCTIGWHRDAPAFGVVVGVSLLASCRLRFQRGTGLERRTWEVLLEPRSGYVLAGEARAAWEHSIPPVEELRYSITFRTLQRSRGLEISSTAPLSDVFRVARRRTYKRGALVLRRSRGK